MAKRLISEAGEAMTLRKPDPSGEYDPTTGSVDYGYNETPVETSFTGARLNYVQSDIDGTLIKQGDQRILMESSLTPETGDRIVIGCDEYVVIRSSPVHLTGQTVVNDVQVRGHVLLG